MQETSDDAMDIDHDDDGLSGQSKDNIIQLDNGQANETNEPNEGINLLEMPREILEHMLINLDDKSMLRASHVCKLFSSVVETAFARKYSSRYFVYYNYHSDESEKSLVKVMLTKYGGQMRRISVNNFDGEILDLIEKNCRSLERVKLISVPKMIHLQDLRKISLIDVRNLDRETFAEFISRNQQLEALKLWDTNLNFLEVLDGRLTSLKKLEYDRSTVFTTNLPKIRLNSLETLKLSSSQNETHNRLLRVLECNQLKRLYLVYCHGPDDSDEVINAICKFKTLTSLRLPFLFQITLSQLTKLAAHLPHLIKLNIHPAERDPHPIVNYVSSVLSIFPKLSKLTFHWAGVFDQFASAVKSSINEFHGRFAGTNTKIEIKASRDDKVILSKDFVYVLESESLELHWMANLNESNVRKAITRVQNVENSMCEKTTDLKFVNHCVGHTLDIWAFLPELKQLECLDIKSEGPITFRANSSRHHILFPCLEILKIRVDERNAIDFLQKLGGSFCERIQELWLDTNARNQELEHAHDMTDILAKFKNLTTLHLVPVFAIFDTKRVLSVCKDLECLVVRR